MKQICLSLSDVAASLRRVSLCWCNGAKTSCLDKPPHRVKVGLIEGDCRCTRKPTLQLAGEKVYGTRRKYFLLFNNYLDDAFTWLFFVALQAPHLKWTRQQASEILVSFTLFELHKWMRDSFTRAASFVKHFIFSNKMILNQGVMY